jgi:predicted nucleic acid-binding protein
MILLDSNVLIALVDQRDSKRVRAVGDLAKLHRRGLLLTWPVVTESLHFLKRRDQREYLRELIEYTPLGFLRAEDEPVFADLMNWLLRYADHEPDLADGYLVLATAKNNRLRVWTYDYEFSAIWRRPDGSAVPMALRR